MRINKIKSRLDHIIQTSLTKMSINLDKPLNRPTSIIFDISDGCILKCKQCHIWKHKAQPPITLDRAKIIIDKIYDWIGPYYLFFTGGEPLMNPFMPEIIKYCHQKGVYTHINTNAFLLDDKLSKKLVESGLSAISISIDGANKKTHDLLRGVDGTYEKAINAIKTLNKYKKNKEKPFIYINTVIMKPNLEQLEELASISTDLNTNGINYQCLLPDVGKIKSSTNEYFKKLWPSDDKKIKQTLQKLSLIKNKNIQQDKAFFDSAIEYYTNPKYINCIQCAVGINNFGVNCRGEVRMCFSYPSIGNIFDTTAKKIWFSKEAQKQRIKIRKCNKPCKIIACNVVNHKKDKAVKNEK